MGLAWRGNLSGPWESIFSSFRECQLNSREQSRKLLNYQTKTTLKDAVIKTCDYIKQNGVKKFKYGEQLKFAIPARIISYRYALGNI